MDEESVLEARLKLLAEYSSDLQEMQSVSSEDPIKRETTMRAQTLPEVIRAFDPRQPLMGQELREWLRDQAQTLLAQSRDLFLTINLPQAATLVDRALENTGH